MLKPRYDPEIDVSRHGAVSRKHCDEMAKRFKWQLVDVEKTNNPMLPVDCVFQGETEFPESYYETQEERDE